VLRGEPLPAPPTTAHTTGGPWSTP
jgi:hypothetical protein